MSRFPNPILIAVLLALPAGAGAPRKVPLQTYATLWTQSPFTVKPLIETEERIEENPFEDWALGGVSGVSDRQLVVLFHRKEAGKQMIVDSGDPKAEFKVIEAPRPVTAAMPEPVALQEPPSRPSMVLVLAATFLIGLMSGVVLTRLLLSRF